MMRVVGVGYKRHCWVHDLRDDELQGFQEKLKGLVFLLRGRPFLKKPLEARVLLNVPQQVEGGIDVSVFFPLPDEIEIKRELERPDVLFEELPRPSLGLQAPDRGRQKIT